MSNHNIFRRKSKPPRSLRVPYFARNLANHFLEQYSKKKEAIIGIDEAHSGLDPRAYSIGTILTFDHVSLMFSDARDEHSEFFPDAEDCRLIQSVATPFVGVISLLKARHILVGYNLAEEMDPILVNPDNFPKLAKLGDLPVWNAITLDDPRIAREMPYDGHGRPCVDLPRLNGTAF